MPESGKLGPSQIEREIRTASGDSEKLLLTPFGENLFRLEESSCLIDAVYRDVIRASETQGGALLFAEVTERSPLVTQYWILSPELIQSERVQSVLQQIMEHDGNWEQLFGGLLFLHAPPEIAEEVEQHMRRIISPGPAAEA